MQFTPIDRSAIPTKNTRANSKASQAVKAFMETGAEVAQVGLAEDEKVESVRSTLGNYIGRNSLPVRLFSRGGNLYIERTDLGAAANGSANEAAEAEAVNVG